MVECLGWANASGSAHNRGRTSTCTWKSRHYTALRRKRGFSSEATDRSTGGISPRRFCKGSVHKFTHRCSRTWNVAHDCERNHTSQRTSPFPFVPRPGVTWWRPGTPSKLLLMACWSSWGRRSIYLLDTVPWRVKLWPKWCKKLPQRTFLLHRQSLHDPIDEPPNPVQREHVVRYRWN